MTLFSPDQQFKAEEPLNLWWWFHAVTKLHLMCLQRWLQCLVMTLLHGFLSCEDEMHMAMCWDMNIIGGYENVMSVPSMTWAKPIVCFSIYSSHPFPHSCSSQSIFFIEAKQIANLFLLHSFRNRDLFTDSPTALSLPLLQLLSEKVDRWGN